MDTRASYDEVWYDYALVQSAAESYLDGVNLANRLAITSRLLGGNNELRPEVTVNGIAGQPNELFRLFGIDSNNRPELTNILPGATRFTEQQASIFLDKYEILDQLPNDAGGFSATVVRERATGQITLSIRSTEWSPQNRGGDRERDIGSIFGADRGADAQIGVDGFAFAQLAAAERYYQQLRTGTLSDGSVDARVRDWFSDATNKVNITGYSLGGHIALALTEMHYQDVGRTFLFNAPGRGAIDDRILVADGSKISAGQAMTALLDLFDRLLTDPRSWMSDPAFNDHVRTQIASIREGAGALTLSDQASEEAAAPGAESVWNAANIYATKRFQWARTALSPLLQSGAGVMLNGLKPWGSSRVDDPAGKIDYVFGNAAHNDDGWVANSGIVPTQSRNWVFVEDQPDGSRGVDSSGTSDYRDADFGRTHSITLLVDSMAVTNLLRTIDPSLKSSDGQERIDAIFASASNQAAPSASWLQAAAGVLGDPLHMLPEYHRTGVEANTLESVLDSLWRIVGDDSRLDIDSTPDGLGNLKNREQFYERVDSLKSEFERLASAGRSLELRPLIALRWQNNTPALRPTGNGVISSYRAEFASFALDLDALVQKAKQADDEGYAYRYALECGDAFVLVGFDYAGSRHNKDEQLELSRGINTASEAKQFSDEYLRQRGEMLMYSLGRRLADQSHSFSSDGRHYLYSDARSEERVPVFGNDVFANALGIEAAYSLNSDERDRLIADRLEARIQSNVVSVVRFGRDVLDDLRGGGLADKLFGRNGDDYLQGNAGDDYLEGGAGADTLEAGDGDDVLNDIDGQGGDRLRGGKGNDTYYADWGDTIRDEADGKSTGGAIYIGKDRQRLTGGERIGDSGEFKSADGKTIYWEAPNGKIEVFNRGASQKLVIDPTTGAVPGRSTAPDGSAVVSGRPDLGIALVTRSAGGPNGGRRPGAIGSLPDRIGDLFNGALNWRPPRDPLALDLDGDGIETIGHRSGSTVRFDHDGDGIKGGTGWLDKDDAWVVLDRDGDTAISTGSELFGVDTVLPTGDKAADGFQAIEQLDTNRDGKVDATDAPLEAWQIERDVDGDGAIAPGETRGASFADLQLWQDLNLDGFSQPGELTSLPDAAISSINLDGRIENRTLADGNTLFKSGTFTRNDGSSGASGALNLATFAFYRSFAAAPTAMLFDSDLPNLAGGGAVRNLREALGDAPQLLPSVDEAARSTTRSEQLSATRRMLGEWANSSSMASGVEHFHERVNPATLIYTFEGISTTSFASAYENATAQTGPVPLSDLPPDWFIKQQSAEYQDRARRLSTLERFYGQAFVNPASAATPVHSVTVPTSQPGEAPRTIQLNAVSAYIAGAQWSALDLAYQILEDTVYGQLTLETRLRPCVDAAVGGAPSRDFTAAEALLQSKHATNPIEAIGDAMDLLRYAGRDLTALGWLSLHTTTEQWVRNALADPSLAPALAELRVAERSSLRLAGSNAPDTLLGSTFRPNDGSTAPSEVQGLEGNDVIIGGRAFENLVGGGGDDVIAAGSGGKEIRGGAGRDLILFGRGAGQVRLELDPTSESGVGMVASGDRDIVQMLPGIRPEDLTVRHGSKIPFGGISGGLSITVTGTGDAITSAFSGGVIADDSRRRLDAVWFADGTKWDQAQLRLEALKGAAGDDTMWGFADSGDVITGGAGNDEIYGLAGDDEISGGDGADRIDGGEGADVLLGGGGADTLTGGTGDDRFDGGSGNDLYVDGPVLGNAGTFISGGRDTFVLARDSGRDIIGSSQYYAGYPIDNENTLEIAPDVLPQDVLIQRRGDSLHFLISGTSAELVDMLSTLPDGTQFPAISEVRFADGTSWDRAEIRRRSLVGSPGNDTMYGWRETDDRIEGHDGNDSLFAQGGNDELIGGAGNDTLEDGQGNDTFEGGPGNDVITLRAGQSTIRFSPGDGGDTIRDFSAYPAPAPTIQFGPGIDPGSLVAYYDGSASIILGDANGSDWIKFQPRSFSPENYPTLRFADGTTIAGSELRARLNTPTTGSDSLRYPGSPDGVNGLAGNDLIDGGYGDDFLYGGAGDDALHGGPGDDALQGDQGDDTLRGGPGSDRYTYLGGQSIGNDTIVLEGGGPDRIELTNVAPSSVRVQADGVSTKLLIGAADSIAIEGDLGQLDAVQFITQQVTWHPIRTAIASSVAQIAAAHATAFAAPSGAFIDADGTAGRTYRATLDNGSALPEWLRLDAQTGSFTATPTAEHAGQYVVRLLAMDSTGFAATHTVNLEVTGRPVNAAPVTAIPLADQTANEDEAFRFVLPAGTFVDPNPGDTLSLSATRADGSALPAWLSFDATTQTFSGTPTNADVGAWSVRVTASDPAGETAVDEFGIAVRNVNDAPVALASLGNATVQEGQSLTYALPTGLFTDVDAGDSLAYSIEALNGTPAAAWLRLDSATGTILGTAPIGATGSEDVVVKATDSAGASASVDFRIDITAAPAITNQGTRGDDAISGTSSDDTLGGRGGNDALFGYGGNDLLRGGAGNDVLQGGSGDDVLRAGGGQNLLDGGTGNDILYGGAGASVLIGGAGDDVIRAGSGTDVIAFNRGDGNDIVYADGAADNTLSLGGGIGYQDLTMRRAGRDLVLDLGENESITFKNWYAANQRPSLLNLQLVSEAMAEFDASSSDPMFANKVQRFDFAGIVSAFDAMQAANPGVSSWALSSALTQFLLSSSDSAAYGGDIAYHYGQRGSLAGIGLANAQEVIGSSQLGVSAQTLRPFEGLQEGLVKLV
jgi:Ca2+-binding RTX toxin-like protein